MNIPVGYNRDITASNRWPGLSCSYEVLPGDSSAQGLATTKQHRFKGTDAV
jgi:hypothetical protein